MDKGKFTGLATKDYISTRLSEQKSYSTSNWQKMGDGPIKLNLGCGDRHWEGYVNCDVWYEGMREPDVQADIKSLPFPGNSCDEVHAIHVIEHIHRWNTVTYLREWTRVLKPGGLLVIECPDLSKIAMQLFSWMDADKPKKFELFDGREVDIVADCKAGLYGDQKHPVEEMVHKWCFTPKELIDLMLDNGIKEVTSCLPQFHRPFRDMRLEGVKG